MDFRELVHVILEAGKSKSAEAGGRLGCQGRTNIVT